MAQHPARILVVEDDASLNEIIRTFLSQEGYDVTCAFSGSEARMLIERESAPVSGAPVQGDAAGFDVIICDLMLPGMSGEELVPFIREHLSNVALIITSAKDAVTDRVDLLRCGADDYLVKPFDLNELAARIEVQLRKNDCGNDPVHPTHRNASQPDEKLTYKSWELFPAQRCFIASGAPLKLTRTEFDIMATLMGAPDRVFSKRALYLATCHDDLALADVACGAAQNVTAADERTISTHISNLRSKLKAAGATDYIETVWGIGFKLG